MKITVVVLIFISVLFIGVSFANAAYSSHTSLSGGASLRTGYNTNVNRTSDDEKDRWESTANASLSLNHSTQGEKGGLSLSASHTVTYSARTEKFSWSDFTLFTNGWRNLSSRLSWDFSNRFVRTNDLWGDYSSSSSTRNSRDEEEDGPAFSDRNTNRKFWTNTFSTGLGYQYARNGSVSIGYGNRILEYDDSDVDNYTSHNASIGTSYQFTDQWNSSLSYSYTDANFDDTQDYTLHNAGFSVGYAHSVWNSFSAGINYAEKNFDTASFEIPEDDKNDYYTVSGNLGWTHAFSPTETLFMSAGPSYVSRDNENSKTAGNFNINYTSAFEHWSWFAGADGGLDDRSLNGDPDEDLSEYKRLAAGANFQLDENLSAGLGASFRDDEFLSTDNDDEETYNANASLHYRFMRWFYLSGRYMYTQVVSNDSDDEYVNHSFFVTLGASRELKRWIH